VVGQFTGTADFGPGHWHRQSFGRRGYVAKLNSSGNFVWAINQGRRRSGCDVNAADQVYTVGDSWAPPISIRARAPSNLTSTGMRRLRAKLDGAGNLA